MSERGDTGEINPRDVSTECYGATPISTRTCGNDLEWQSHSVARAEPSEGPPSASVLLSREPESGELPGLARFLIRATWLEVTQGPSPPEHCWVRGQHRHGSVPPDPLQVWFPGAVRRRQLCRSPSALVGDHRAVRTQGPRTLTRTRPPPRNVLREGSLTQGYVLGRSVYTEFHSGRSTVLGERWLNLPRGS